MKSMRTDNKYSILETLMEDKKVKTVVYISIGVAALYGIGVLFKVLGGTVGHYKNLKQVIES